MRGVATISAAGAVVLTTALAGCYDAHPAAGAPCDLELDNCPSGQHCIDTGAGAFCGGSKPGTLPDGSTLSDGPRPDNAPNCYGTGLVHDLCAITPTGDLTINADRVLNTSMIGGTNCETIIAQPGGGATLCLVTAQHISIASGVKVAVTGPNPLVLVGTMGLSIAGTLDGSSHRGGTDGPGAQTSCGTGTEGGVGGPPANGPGGGGGGAGGSFGTIGGVGGVGYHSSTNNPGGPGGTPVAITTTLSTLVGGCPGGRGGYGFGSPAAGDGPGGHGGGALYLITTGTLTISGVVTASGAGATGGGPGTDCSGGGGGGGAGGFIGLDAPSLSITGAVYANGGGGGGGGGTDVQFPGSVGNDPSSPTAAATGGNGGSGGGGNGGNGYAGASIAKKGNDGTGPYSGAGGGGGGAGIIKIYGTTASGGTFSPQPN